MAIDPNFRRLGMSQASTTIAVAETLNDVSGTYNERNLTYNGS